MPLSVFMFMLIAAFCVALILVLRNKIKLDANRKKKDKLKLIWNKIRVDLEDCVIKSREGYEDAAVDSIPSKIEMLDTLHDSSRGQSQVKTCVSVLQYRYKVSKSKEMEFRSDLIKLPIESLRLRLDTEKFTYIYVDPKSYSNYLFDIDFLYEEN